MSAPAMPTGEAWFAERLALVARVNGDRALAPATRHVLIETLLEEGDEPDEEGLGWTARLARRLGLTDRAVRKALAALAAASLIDRGLIERSGVDRGGRAPADTMPWPRLDRIAERLGRAPPVEALAADPVVDHALRLEALRDQADEAGLIATALSAEREIGRVLGHIPPRPRRDAEAVDFATMPPAERKGRYYNMVIPMLRDWYTGDPEQQDRLLAFIADFRAAATAAKGGNPAGASL